MNSENQTVKPVHSFHIPVMGLGYTIDTALKVARFGISSVLSVMEDHLIERMREFHSVRYNIPYTAISSDESDARARRITAYLDLIQDIVDLQIAELRSEEFVPGSDICKYFELLADGSYLKDKYLTYMASDDVEEKEILDRFLRKHITAGEINVNIMTKLDKPNFSADGNALPLEFSDAMSALRGFANSKLSSSLVLSAGLNPRLYSYCAGFSDFLPDANGEIKKKIILKVSDLRSASIQGMFLAKKGIWVSEFRIESGLNCGGHAFATDGFLMGPVLEEFRENRHKLREDLYEVCSKALAALGYAFKSLPDIRVTAQGGLGTNSENELLLKYYDMDSVGWGSPFLLVPEACNIDTGTLDTLQKAKPHDYYLSDSSPLGVPFNNLKSSSSEKQRLERIGKNRPGSPCYKKFLAFNTEFGEAPLCTASRKYQHLKISELDKSNLSEIEYKKAYENIVVKDCLCEGLGASALLGNNLEPSHNLKAVTICPGPNLAYFTGVFSLRDMCAHIYGRHSLLNNVPRSHVFINELWIYINYLEKQIEKCKHEVSQKIVKRLSDFKLNISKGIDYYNKLIPVLQQFEGHLAENFQNELQRAAVKLKENTFILPSA